MKYRREIDGLRAVAVVPVILFHAGLTIFEGGYLGVDIFFVISGYLITGIIIAELDEERFSIRRFYERRARRILPALFFVILCCLPFAWMWMLPEAFIAFCQSIIATVLFGSNILFWKQSDYFADAAELRPLLHTWSLAVEEQYYIFFPLVLILLWRFGRWPTFYVVAALACISLLISEWGWRNAPSGNFYLLPPRAWELLAGSLCAFLRFKTGPRPNELLSLAGLGMVAFALAFYDESYPIPSLYGLVPVGGVALILLYGSAGTIAARILSWPIFVGIGLISYSAYLWHQPLFAFARIRSIYEPEQGLMAGLAVLALVLAYLSWRFVEQPFRRKEGQVLPTQKRIFVAALVGSLAFIGIGGAGVWQKGLPDRFEASALSVANVVPEWNTIDERACTYEVGAGRRLPELPDPACTYPAKSPSKGQVALIGDSHSSALAAPVIQALTDAGYSVMQISILACAPFRGFRRANVDCGAVNDRVHKVLRAGDFDMVIASFRPQPLFQDPFDNHEGGQEAHAYSATFFDQSYLEFAPEASARDKALALFRQGLTDLAGLTDHLIVVDPVPEAGWHVGDLRRKIRIFAPDQAAAPVSTRSDLYRERNGDIIALFDSLDLPNLYRVRPQDVLCDAALEGRCLNAIDGVAYYKDNDHLSYAGAELLLPQLMAHIAAIEAQDALN